MPWEIFSNLFFRTYSIKYVREIPLSTTVLVLKIPLFSFWIFFNKSDFSTIFTLLSCLYHNLYKHECKVCISKNMFLLFLLCLCMRTHLRYESHLESRLSVPNRCLCFQKAQGSEINFLALPLPLLHAVIFHIPLGEFAQAFFDRGFGFEAYCFLQKICGSKGSRHVTRFQRLKDFFKYNFTSECFT